MQASLFAGRQCIAADNRGDFVVETHQRWQSVHPQHVSSLAFLCEQGAPIVVSLTARSGQAITIIQNHPQALERQGLLLFEPIRPRSSARPAGVKNV
jgi:hypothetical protein